MCRVEVFDSIQDPPSQDPDDLGFLSGTSFTAWVPVALKACSAVDTASRLPLVVDEVFQAGWQRR